MSTVWPKHKYNLTEEEFREYVECLEAAIVANQRCIDATNELGSSEEAKQFFAGTHWGLIEAYERLRSISQRGLRDKNYHGPIKTKD
jgi:hypothetical protein